MNVHMQSSPERVNRDILESIGRLGVGKWRIVYAEECTTSFGFGSFFIGGANSADVEIENDGRITCTYPITFLCPISVPGHLFFFSILSIESR